MKKERGCLSHFDGAGIGSLGGGKVQLGAKLYLFIVAKSILKKDRSNGSG